MQALARCLREGIAGRLLAALRRLLARRRAIASLHGLDERMLKDVGLYRSDVEANAFRRAVRDREERLFRHDAH